MNRAIVSMVFLPLTAIGVWALSHAQAEPETGLVIRCTTALDCKVEGYEGKGPVQNAKPEPTEALKKSQTWTVAFAQGSDVPGHDEVSVLHGTHCWVQLPNGTWQLYHCAP